MLLREQQEVIRPAQRAVDPELVRVHCGVGNGGIVNVDHQGLNGGTSDGPAQDGHRSLGGLSRQVDTYRDHSRSVSRSLNHGGWRLPESPMLPAGSDRLCGTLSGFERGGLMSDFGYEPPG